MSSIALQLLQLLLQHLVPGVPSSTYVVDGLLQLLHQNDPVDAVRSPRLQHAGREDLVLFHGLLRRFGILGPFHPVVAVVGHRVVTEEHAKRLHHTQMDRLRSVKVLHILTPDDAALLYAKLEPLDFVLGGQREDESHHGTRVLVLHRRRRLLLLAKAIRVRWNGKLTQEHVVVVLVMMVRSVQRYAEMGLVDVGWWQRWLVQHRSQIAHFDRGDGGDDGRSLEYL